MVYEFILTSNLYFTEAATRGVLWKGAPINFTKFTGKHLRQSLLFNKITDLKAATLLKKKLWHKCFPVNFAKFLRTPYLQNTSERLLLILFVACFFIFSFTKNFRNEKVASCEKSRLVENRLKSPFNFHAVFSNSDRKSYVQRQPPKVFCNKRRS